MSETHIKEILRWVKPLRWVKRLSIITALGEALVDHRSLTDFPRRQKRRSDTIHMATVPSGTTMMPSATTLVLDRQKDKPPA